jgi:hypothetical protein
MRLDPFGKTQGRLRFSPHRRWIALGTDPVRSAGRFLFQRRVSISDSQALGQILAKKRNDAAQSLVLSGVNELVNQKLAVLAAIAAHENPMSKGEPSRSRREKINRAASCFQHWMHRRWNRFHLQQPHAFRFFYAGRFCVENFRVRQRDAFTQDSGLLFGGPIGGQGQQSFELGFRELWVHSVKCSKNLAIAVDWGFLRQPRMLSGPQNGASRAAATWTGRSQDGVSGSERIKTPYNFSGRDVV